MASRNATNRGAMYRSATRRAAARRTGVWRIGRGATSRGERTGPYCGEQERGAVSRGRAHGAVARRAGAWRGEQGGERTGPWRGEQGGERAGHGDATAALGHELGGGEDEAQRSGARPVSTYDARGIGDATAALGRLALAAHACARRRSSRPRRHAPCSPPHLPAPSPRLPTLAAARLALSGDLRFDSFGTRSEGSDAELLDMGTRLGEVYIDGEEHDVGKKTHDTWTHLVSGSRNL